MHASVVQYRAMQRKSVTSGRVSICQLSTWERSADVTDFRCLRSLNEAWLISAKHPRTALRAHAKNKSSPCDAVDLSCAGQPPQ